MKNIQRIIIVALMAVVMIACNKNNELSNLTSTSTQKSTVVTSAHNHTHPSRKCASKAHTESKLQDPVYRVNYEKRMARFESNLRTAKSRSTSAPAILPIAVHYQGANASDKTCLINAAKQAVAVLNADFQAKNSDIVQWDNKAASYYPNINKGIAALSFQLGSKNHPAGFGLQNGDLAITINKVSGDESNAWKGYINIFVGDADGNLGYAPLGGSGNGDGVMINQEAFTIGTTCGAVKGNAPNDLGRTLTHEMGHYLNLDHLWGDGGCNSDDQVQDTPNQAGENYGCPSLGNTKGCSAEALHMNFMDYADDACMYMFSAGQARRMEAWVSSGLLNNLKQPSVIFGGSTGGGDTNGDDVSDNDAGNDDTDAGNDDTDAGGDDASGDTDTGGGDTDGGDTNEDDTDYDDEDYDDSDYNDEDYDDSDYDNEDYGDTDENNTATSRISIQVTLDDFGSETTFAIEDAYGDIIAEYGPFQDGQEGRKIKEELELPTGVYTYVIFDDYGDGICCDEGNGKWKLSKDGVVLKSSNGKFGDWEEFDFAVGGARLSAPAHRIDTKDFNQLKKKQQKLIKTRG